MHFARNRSLRRDSFSRPNDAAQTAARKTKDQNVTKNREVELEVNIQETKLTAELGSSGELNKYLSEGWVLILSYVKHASDTQQARFVVAWQNDGPPVFPEILDEWEQREIRRNKNR